MHWTVKADPRLCFICTSSLRKWWDSLFIRFSLANSQEQNKTDKQRKRIDRITYFVKYKVKYILWFLLFAKHLCFWVVTSKNYISELFVQVFRCSETHTNGLRGFCSPFGSQELFRSLGTFLFPFQMEEAGFKFILWAVVSFLYF